MAQEKFEQAREFIARRQYDKAREILKTMDHPKAQEWLSKIDAIGPNPAQGMDSTRIENRSTEIPNATSNSKTTTPLDAKDQQLKALNGISGGVKLLTFVNLLLFVATLFIGVVIVTKVLPLQSALVAASNGGTPQPTYTTAPTLTPYPTFTMMPTLTPYPTVAPIAQSKTVYETKIVDCGEIDIGGTKDGWRVVSAYSYSTGFNNQFTVYNMCILERPKN